MDTVKRVLRLYLAAVLILDTAELAQGSSLHAVLGIDWTQMESRATSGHWLTNRFVPEEIVCVGFSKIVYRVTMLLER